MCGVLGRGSARLCQTPGGDGGGAGKKSVLDYRPLVLLLGAVCGVDEGEFY